MFAIVQNSRHYDSFEQYGIKNRTKMKPAIYDVKICIRQVVMTWRGQLKAIFKLIVFAVVSCFTVFTGCYGNLRKLATALRVVVILASANVAQNSLLIFHDLPPIFIVNKYPTKNTSLTK